MATLRGACPRCAARVTMTIATGGETTACPACGARFRLKQPSRSSAALREAARELRRAVACAKGLADTMFADLFPDLGIDDVLREAGDA